MKNYRKNVVIVKNILPMMRDDTEDKQHGVGKYRLGFRMYEAT